MPNDRSTPAFRFDQIIICNYAVILLVRSVSKELDGPADSALGVRT
jgi:hypothetical protein